MYQVRIIVDHFTIGTTHFPKGETIQVNQVVRDYLVKEKRAVDITDGDTEVDETPKATGYNRRDMQADGTPPIPVPQATPKAQPKATPATPKKRGRGRPRKVKVDE